MCDINSKNRDLFHRIIHYMTTQVFIGKAPPTRILTAWVAAKNSQRATSITSDLI